MIACLSTCLGYAAWWMAKRPLHPHRGVKTRDESMGVIKEFCRARGYRVKQVEIGVSGVSELRRVGEDRWWSS